VHESVGPISLCDLPSMMAEHDASHRLEISAWIDDVQRRAMLTSDLRKQVGD